MITAIGLDSDPTIQHFLERCRASNVEMRFVNLHDLVESDWLLRIPGHDAVYTLGGVKTVLSASDSYYVRLIDLSSVVGSLTSAQRWQGCMAALMSWLEVIPGIVINRPGHVHDNAAKPLHEATLAQRSFRVPSALTSSDPDMLHRFAAASACVVKAISGVRADCRAVTAAEFINFDRRGGPVHLQHRIDGIDVRAHVIGDTIIAVRIVSNAVDYRLDADEADYQPVDLPASLQRHMIATAQAMGLAFSGWDFKYDRDGVYWLLEVNPMPGYSGYDRHLHGRITTSLLAALQREIL